MWAPATEQVSSKQGRLAGCAAHQQSSQVSISQTCKLDMRYIANMAGMHMQHNTYMAGMDMQHITNMAGMSAAGGVPGLQKQAQ